VQLSLLLLYIVSILYMLQLLSFQFDALRDVRKKLEKVPDLEIDKVQKKSASVIIQQIISSLCRSLKSLGIVSDSRLIIKFGTNVMFVVARTSVFFFLAIRGNVGKTQVRCQPGTTASACRIPGTRFINLATNLFIQPGRNSHTIEL
jgi:hypothetical protein